MAAREQLRGWCGCGDAGPPALSSPWRLLQYSVLKDAYLFPSQTIFWTTLNEYYSKYLRTLSFLKIKDVKISHLRNLQDSSFPINSTPWILRDRTTENNLGRLIFLLWLKPFTTKWKNLLISGFCCRVLGATANRTLHCGRFFYPPSAVALVVSHPFWLASTPSDGLIHSYTEF